jgi:hypothetical protein
MAHIDDLIQARAQKIALPTVASLSRPHRIPSANHRLAKRITNPFCKESTHQIIFSGKIDYLQARGSNSKSTTSEFFTDDWLIC